MNVFKGIFLPFDPAPNGNNRIYTLASISDNVYSEKWEYGECLYYKDPNDYETVDINNVSHSIHNIRIINEGITGEIRLLNTPMGNICKKIKHDICVRPRMKGYITHGGHVTIESIISFDILPILNDAFNPYSYKNKRFSLLKKCHE